MAASDLNLDNVKILMVGAGGIGCELLKNLVLSGFHHIEVIDLDTIELSNLNRQFLFQKIHVGKSKAIIARESVLKYNPNANITAHHDSIMNVKYNVEYFKQFNIVLNALDNKAARSHVNRLCLAANIPLVESGSAGYLGQVTLIKKDLTECYDCLPKPPAKTFPGCTIRNTPSEPIHCIVWAKHLFNQLFGAEDPDEAVSPDGEDPENMAEAGKTAFEKSSTEEAVVRKSTRQWAIQTNYDSIKIFNKLFNDDIKYLLSMSKLWEKRRAPVPLDWQEVSKSEETERENDENLNKPSSYKVWSLSECCKIFQESVKALDNKLNKQMSSTQPILYWDKDDEEAMNFVAAAANLRCFIFSIQVKSKFEIKSLAGNIIPAIATTNAIVAGLIVLQAFKVLNNKLDECKTVYLRDKPIQNRVIVSAELVVPNPKCYVCAKQPEISIKLDLNTFTIKNLETKILKGELNMIQPDVEIDDGTGRIIISSEEGETEENNDKTLSFFGLTDQSILKCDDFFQNYQLKLILYQVDKNIDDTSSSKEYEIISDNQMFKDIQEKISKKTDLVEDKYDEKSTENIQKNYNQEEKKRTYETAFEAESDEISTYSDKTEKLKSSKKLKKSNIDNEDNDIIDVDKEQILSNNASISDASDALSDEEQTVEPNNYLSSKTFKKNPISEEVIEDDDCIIEEDSNDLRLSNGNVENLDLPKSKINNTNDYNNTTEEDDDDVIECSSDEEDQQKSNKKFESDFKNKKNQDYDQDIIEINDGESSNSNQTNSFNKKLESNGNDKNEDVNADNSSVILQESSNKVYQSKVININIEQNDNLNNGVNGISHENNDSSSKNKPKVDDTDDSVTVIE